MKLKSSVIFLILLTIFSFELSSQITSNNKLIKPKYLTPGDTVAIVAPSGVLKNYNNYISKAKELQIPVLVDPKGKKWKKYYGASIITPNLKEAEEAIGRELITDEDVETAGKEICEDLSLGACLITRGANGMSYIGKDVSFHISSEAKEIYDVSGAGDTVIASFAAALLAGFDFSTVTKFANKAAGIVVGHIGTSAITIPELKEDSN